MGRMTASEWKKKKEEEKKQGTSQSYDAQSTSGETPKRMTPSEWKERKATTSLKWWAKSSIGLLDEMQGKSKSWSYKDAHNDYSTKISSLLSQADGWRKQYAGNDEAISYINSVVSALSDTKQQSGKIARYYSSWDTEDAYIKGAAENVEARQQKHEDMLKRIEELKATKKRLSSTQASNNAPYQFGDTSMGFFIPATDPSYSSRIKDIDSEIESLEAEIRMYERGEGGWVSKVSDDYNKVTQNSDFAVGSANRGYKNPTKEDFGMVDLYNNSSTWHFDDDGVYRDVFGNELAVDENHTYYNPMAQQFKVEDKLGMYLSASEDERIDAIYSEEYEGGAWESYITEGYNGAWELLNEKELEIYYYLLEGSQETAYKYLSDMETELNRRRTLKNIGKWHTAYDEANALEKIALNAATIPAKFFSNISGTVENVINTVQGNDINPYSLAHEGMHYSQTVRGATAEDLDKTGFKIPVIDFTLGDIYQTGMSRLDSALATSVFGGGGTVFLGMGAAQEEAYNLYQQGASAEQITLGSFAAGAAEAIWENLSYGKLKEIQNVGSPGAWVKSILVQGFNEASEEALTEVSNIISNALIMGSQSDLAELYHENEESAFRTFVDLLKQTTHSAFGGFIGGIGAGATQATAAYADTMAQYRDTGKDIMSVDGGAKALKELSDKVAGVSEGKMKNTLTKQASKVSENVATGKGIGKVGAAIKNARNEANLGKLYNTVQTANNLANASANQADIAKSLQRKGFNAETASDIASALVAKYNGQELTKAQENLLKSVEGNKVVNDAISNIMDNVRSTMGQRSKDVRGFQNSISKGLILNEIREVVRKKTTDKQFTPTGKYEVSDSGKAIDTESGNEIDIKKVSSISSGKMILELTDGSTIDASKVSFASNSDALIYEAVANLGDNISADNANKLISKFDGKGNAEAFARGIAQAYTHGFYGLDKSEMSLAGELTKEQVNLAYGLGEQYRSVKDQADKGKARALKAPGEKGVYYRDKNGIATDIRSYLKQDGRVLNEMQTTAIEFMEKMSKMMGVRFNVFESWEENGTRYYLDEDGVVQEGSPNGFYVKETGEIYIDLYAGNDFKGAMLFTVAHELTHFMRQWSPESFTKIAKIVFQHAGFKGNVEGLIADKMNGKRDYDYDTAMEEVVADAMETILKDGKVAEFMVDVKKTDSKLWVKLKEWFKNFAEFLKKMVDAYSGRSAYTVEGRKVADFSKKLLNQIEQIWAEGAVSAGETYQAALESVGGEVDIDGDANKHLLSDKSIIEGAGLQFIPSEDGTHYKVLDANGKEVKEVTTKMIVDSPLGDLVTIAMENGFLGEGKKAIQAATKQYEFLADLVNMCIRYDGIAPIWETAGTMVFSSIKSNADKQYGLTIDFSTVCKKTQAIVDAMSEAMVRLGRGLTRSEVETIYLEVGKAGESTPCPVCYVFSRWMGIGGILDQINRFQEKYHNMSEAKIQSFIRDIKGRIEERANTPNSAGKLKADFFKKDGSIKEGSVISDLKAKAQARAGSTLNAIAKNSDIQLQIQELEVLMENQDAKEAKKTAKKIDKLKAKLVDVAQLEKQFKQYNDEVEDYEAYQWLTRTLMKEENGEWVKNEAFKPVPPEVLFDLNKGAIFAEEYPLSWAFRTGKGAAAGKAITPYADARVGEAIQGIASQDVKSIKTGIDLNPFLNGDKKTRQAIVNKAIVQQARQNLIGGQRYQSTSDFRYEYGSDYLITFLEMQAIGAKVQLYTKVIEAVDFLASMGADINLSVMPLSNGFVTLPDGTKKLIYSSVTGIDKDAALAKVHEYDNVQLILVGISDEHIRLALEGEDVTFVIPFHGSGNTVHQIQVLMNLLGENLDVTTAQDYTAVQSDHVSPNQTKEQKALWNLRVKIITGKASTLSTAEYALLENNSYLKDLHRRFYLDKSADEYGISLTSDQANQIFPYEYWDKSLTYAEADKNGERFKEYCASMGIIPRFSGMNSKGESVGFGDFTGDKGYWKLLIDRRMYDNTYDRDGNWTGYGKYHVQKRINCSDFQVKHLDPEYGSATYGDVMSKANDPKKTSAIVDRAIAQFENKGTMFSDRKTFKNGQNDKGEFFADILIDLADMDGEWWTGRYNHAILSMSKSDDTEFRQFYQEILKRTKDMEEYGEADNPVIETAFVVQDGKGRKFIYRVALDGYLHGVVVAKINLARYKSYVKKYGRSNNHGRTPANTVRRVGRARANLGSNGSGSSGSQQPNGNSGSSGVVSISPQGNIGGNDRRGESADQEVPTVTDSNPASDFVSHMRGKVKDTGGWYAKDVFKYVQEHPSLNFIDRIFEKDKAIKKDLENFLNGIDDTSVLEGLSWFMGEAYGDKGRTWTWDDGASYPYRGAVRTFRNAVKKRINAIMTEKVGGTDLGIKNGDVTLEDIKGLYGKLNSNDEMKEFAEKVFATAEKLGVNIRFVNQTLSKQRVAGDNLGDMVEYKTSYFNDTAVTDQKKANTILHELIHACTVYVLDANKFMGDVSWSNKSENYNRIANAAQRLNRIYHEIQYDPDFRGQYGIKNVKEMVAELANPEFVGLMKKKNLWDNIVDFICELFGIRRGSSAYDNARLCLDYILDNPEVSEYKEHAAEMRRRARYSGYDVFGQTLYSDRILMGSLFSGGGTLEAGLVYQMLDKEFAVEYNKKIAATYTDNHGKEHMFVGDVQDFDSKDKQDVFYLHASPVCKNFSPASHSGGETTIDIVTAQATARVLEEQMPQVFTVENVKRYRGSEAYTIIIDKLNELGYTWDVDVYKASDYGNATKRERMIIRAVKDGDLPAKPAKASSITSWGEATRDLWETDLIPSTLVKSKIEAIRNTPALKNLKLTKLDKPLMIYDTSKSKQAIYAWADELAPTLTTKCGDARIIMPDGKVYEPTPKFMGRIQGLPDDYKYPKAKTNAFKIIGNGIPTQLTKAVIGGVLDSAYEQTHEGKTLYSDRDYVAYDLTAILKEETVDRWLREYATKSQPKYAQAYITYIRPDRFLDLTTSVGGRAYIESESRELDEADFADYTKDNPILLEIDHETGNVTGHEGRHRCVALQRAGITYVPVLLLDYSNKYDKQAMDSLKLTGQVFANSRSYDQAYVYDILPLNYENREEVIKRFATQSSMQRTGERLGIRQTLRFQDRADNSVSNRSLLANAFEGIAKPEEKQKIQEYKAKIALIEEEEDNLRELNKEIKRLSFAEGKRDFKRINALRFEATQAANRINTYDKILLRMEASKPLQDVLAREKKLAYKKAEQRGKEALAEYKAKVEAKQKETTEKWRESRKTAVAKARETAEKRDARAKLQKLVLDTVKWISYPAKTDVKCPDILKKPYEAFLQGIDLSSKRLANGGEATNNDLRLANAMDSLATAIDRVMLSQDPSQEVDKVLDIGYLDLPADFVQKLRDMTESIKSMMVEGEYVVNTMTAAEVRQLSQMIRTLNHAIKTMSNLYANLRFANVEALGFDTMDFLDAVGEIEKTGGMKDFVEWDNALPYYAFKRFGKGGESIFEGLMDAQDKLAFLAQGIFDFQEKTWTGEEAKAWSEDTHTITLPNGTELTLTTADAMSIYCLSRREQALPHLLGGGIRVMGIQKGSQKAKDSRSLLTIEDVSAIISSLTDRQKQVAEAMQEFMSTVCSDWGNEISMKRFLTREFTEKFYFPIESNDENLTVKDPAAQQSDLFRLLNISATKPLTQGANNEVIIRNIFDVFTGHASDMARLNAYGMGLLDYMKWLNYRERSVSEEGQINVKGVRKSMEKAYGKAANGYIINLIKDVNGRASDGGDPSILMKWMRAAKTASVGSSLRVAALQITSYPRALLVLSPKSLSLGLTKKPNIEKAKKYCGVALWKSFGFYDTNISRSIEDQMKGVTDIKQKLIELSLKGAELGDAITWGALWNACEYEVAQTTKNKVGSEEFYQEVGKKLREVVYRTQVVDSTLTRSQIMRSKRGMAQEAAAFMSEPTLSANILMDAGFEFSLEKRRTGNVKDAWKKTSSYIGKAVAVYSIGQLTAALLESFFDAWRDDEDEEFWKKYLSAFGENLALDLVPFNKLPIVSDVFEGALSLFGVGFYSSDKMSTTWLTQAISAVDAWKKVFSGGSSTTVYNALYKTTRALSSSIGISVSGAMREAVALWNNTAGAYDSTLKIRQYDLANADLGVELYEAIMSGNTRQADSLKAQFDDVGAMHSAIRKALRENDPRIKEAASADYIDHNPSERVRIAKLIIADGFDQDDVVLAINSEIAEMKPDEGSSDPKAKGLYTADHFAREIANRDQASAYEAKADIIATEQKNGRSEEDAVKKFNSSAKTALGKLFKSGELTEQEVITALTTFCDMEEDDAKKYVGGVAYEVEHPELDGVVSYSEYQRWEADGKPYGVSIEMFIDVAGFRDDGTSNSVKSQDEVALYISSVTSDRRLRHALWCCFYKASTSPWK